MQCHGVESYRTRRAAHQSDSLYGQRRQSGRGSGSRRYFSSRTSPMQADTARNRGKTLTHQKVTEIRGYYGKF
ncbi:hypothetical protein ACNKHW_14035 [Shigella flexneri]